MNQSDDDDDASAEHMTLPYYIPSQIIGPSRSGLSYADGSNSPLSQTSFTAASIPKSL